MKSRVLATESSRIRGRCLLLLVFPGLWLGCAQGAFLPGVEEETAILEFATEEAASLDGRRIPSAQGPQRIAPGAHELRIRFAESASAGSGRTISGEGECHLEFVAEVGHAYRVYTDWEKRDLFRDDEGRYCASELADRKGKTEAITESAEQPGEDDCASYKWAPIRRLGVVEDTGDGTRPGSCFIGG